MLKTPADGARRLTPSPYWVSSMDPIVPRNPRISRGPLPIPDGPIIMDRLRTENSGTALFLVQPVESEFPTRLREKSSMAGFQDTDNKQPKLRAGSERQ